jgi:hypothetical protein
LYKGGNLQNPIIDEVIDEKQNFLMEGQRLSAQRSALRFLATELIYTP